LSVPEVFSLAHCSGAGSLAAVPGATAATAKDEGRATKLTVWVGWRARRELRSSQKVARSTTRRTQNVTVDVGPGGSKRRPRSSPRSAPGQRAPTSPARSTPYDVGHFYCGTRWAGSDLSQLMKQSGDQDERFPGGDQLTTRSSAARSVRCPLLGPDTYRASTTTRISSRRRGSTARRRRFRRAHGADGEEVDQVPTPTGRSKGPRLFDPFHRLYENTPERWVTAWGARTGFDSVRSTRSWEAARLDVLDGRGCRATAILGVGYKKLREVSRRGLATSSAFETRSRSGKAGDELRAASWRVAFIQAEPGR